MGGSRLHTQCCAESDWWLQLQHMRALLMLEMDQHDAARTVFEQLLRSGNSDNWDFLVSWLDTTQQLHADAWVEPALQLADELDELSGQKKRGAHAVAVVGVQRVLVLQVH